MPGYNPGGYSSGSPGLGPGDIGEGNRGFSTQRGTYGSGSGVVSSQVAAAQQAAAQQKAKADDLYDSLFGNPYLTGPSVVKENAAPTGFGPPNSAPLTFPSYSSLEDIVAGFNPSPTSPLPSSSGASGLSELPTMYVGQHPVQNPADLRSTNTFDLFSDMAGTNPGRSLIAALLGGFSGSAALAKSPNIQNMLGFDPAPVLGNLDRSPQITKTDYDPTLVDPYDPFAGMEDDGGNVAAIRRFMQDPSYGNIPQVDPISALAAYENAVGGIDELVGERGFTDRGYAQAARDRAASVFDKFTGEDDYDTMLNNKIGRAFADEALFNKDIELRGQGIQAVEQTFPQGYASNIFDANAFSEAAENIYGNKLSGAQELIARAGSRGQLSPRGGSLASESLLSQGPDVRSRISDTLGGVRSEAESGLSGISGEALKSAQGYQLGDELFDVTPFGEQAADYLRTAAADLPNRITTAIGSDPLFSAVSALQEGGRQQGQVSGTPSFLDTLADRQGSFGTGKDKRGLGSRGSGVF